MAAVPPLARVLRYGNVRQTDTGVVRGVVDSLLIRVCAGLPAACAQLDDDAAADMREAIEARGRRAVARRPPEQVTAWRGALRSVADLAAGRPSHQPPGPGRRPVRPAAARRLRPRTRAGRTAAGPSPVRPRRSRHARSAGWKGSCAAPGLLLLRDQALWQLLDDWLCGLRRRGVRGGAAAAAARVRAVPLAGTAADGRAGAIGPEDRAVRPAATATRTGTSSGSG